ncbi:Protein of unknown function DUF4449 [Phaffia rhodozyma]|uniref:Uncharacterized protein n=1 Tax=Phaffia rhodozyma TaxID=264483 RepID=A0A0F7SSD1_PHARH|nr:Protein of unknown function DUF4449 [Phaffia rhodozyma]
MTVPQATQQITNNPSHYAVTSPTVKKDQEADVERKMKLYGVIQAFRDGSFPSNSQIDAALLATEKATPVDIRNLSPSGKKLINDVRDIIETARLMILTKNSDELFQNFIYHTKKTDTTKGAQDKSVLPTSKGEVKNEAVEAASHLRTLLTLVLTNSEMRKVISDLGLVGRDLFASAAVRTAEKVRPDEEELNQVDKEAPSGQWEGPGGKKYGTNETPVLEANIAGHKVTHDPKAPVAEGTVHTDPNGNKTNAGEAVQQAKQAKNEAQAQKEDAKGQAGGLKEQAKQVGSQKFEEGKQAYREDGVEGVKQHGRNMKSDADDRSNDDDAQKAKGKFAAFKDKLSPGDSSRDKANQQKEKVTDFLDEEFPQERRDQFIYRMKKVVVECQKHNDYDEAISFFLDKAETYKGHTKSLTETGADSTGAVASDPSFQQAYGEMKTLLERFADGESMDRIVDAVNNLYVDAQNDRELSAWFRKLDSYVRKCLLEPGYILEDESTREGQSLRETGKAFFDHKYKAHKDAFFDEVGNWFSAMGKDPVNVRFGEDWKRLVADVLFDENGQLTFKPELWNDIRREILPSLINQVGYIPIPRIEYTDKQVDLVIENLVLQGSNLFPNIVELSANNYFKFSPYRGIPDKSYHKFSLHFSQVQADMREVGFYFKKKTGFPKLKDSGLADVLLSGDGLTVDVELESAGSRTDHVFLIKHVNATVDTLKFSIRDSKHDLLYKIMAPLAQGLIKKTVGLAVEQAIKTGLEYVDEQLVEVRNRMDAAKDSDSLSRTDALKEMFQRKKEKAEVRKEKAKEKADERGSQFAIVTSRDASVIPNSNPPHSKGEKIFEKDKLAKAGETWHSPAFSIAGESDLSGLRSSTSGSHNTASHGTTGSHTTAAPYGTTSSSTAGFTAAPYGTAATGATTNLSSQLGSSTTHTYPVTQAAPTQGGYPISGQQQKY